MSERRAIHEITPGAQGKFVTFSVPRAMTHRAGLRPGEVAYALETDAGILLLSADVPFARVLEADGRISQALEDAPGGPAKDTGG